MIFMGLKYAIKKSIIKHSVKKRKKGYKCDERDAGTFNNSYYYTAHNSDGESMFFRLGYRSDGEKEVWAVFVDAGGKEYVNKTDNAGSGNKPDGGCYFNYEEQDFSIRGEFTPTGNIYDFTRDSDPEIYGRMLAKMKWTKDFANVLLKLNQTHIEQSGTIRAIIKIKDKEIEFTAPGIRDHSWGRRVWSDMQSHKWFIATAEDGASMCATTVNGLIAGYYAKDGVTKNVLDIQFGDGVCVVTLADKTVLDCTYKIRHSVRFTFEKGAYTIDEGVSSFTINGVPARGITEFGINTKEKKTNEDI
jgi:hypothetical protein